MFIKYYARNKICIQLQLISLLMSKNVYVFILFCRVISQQHGDSGDLRYKVFVIAILHCQKFMHYRCLRK